MSAFILSGPISQILNHVTTYLDELSSNLATKAVQASMQTTLGTVNTNVSTILGRVPAEVAPKSTLDTVNTNLSTVLTDTGDMQPKVNEIVEDTREIVIDTREIVGDVNAVLTDTAALDSRLNATWAGRLNTTISSRLSSAVRAVHNGHNAGNTTSTGTGIDTRYLDVTVNVTNYTKCLVTGVFGGGSTAASWTLATSGGTTYVAFGRMINNSTMRISSVSSSATYIGGQWSVVEFY